MNEIMWDSDVMQHAYQRLRDAVDRSETYTAEIATSLTALTRMDPNESGEFIAKICAELRKTIRESQDAKERIAHAAKGAQEAIELFESAERRITRWYTDGITDIKRFESKMNPPPVPELTPLPIDSRIFVNIHPTWLLMLASE